MELAWRLWGERRRRTVTLRYLSWTVSTMMAPHVSQRDRHLIASDRLLVGIAGGDLDEDEVMR